ACGCKRFGDFTLPDAGGPDEREQQRTLSVRYELRERPQHSVRLRYRSELAFGEGKRSDAVEALVEPAAAKHGAQNLRIQLERSSQQRLAAGELDQALTAQRRIRCEAITALDLLGR